jgi:hypothetical protein
MALLQVPDSIPYASSDALFFSAPLAVKHFGSIIGVPPLHGLVNENL